MFKICKGLSRIRPEELFHFDDRGKGTRGHSLKVVKLGACGTVEDIFSNRVIKRWNQLEQGHLLQPASTHLKVNQTDLELLRGPVC